MKVDPNLQSIANLQSDAVQNGKTTRTQGAASGISTSQVDGTDTDTVEFSPKFAQIQQLTSKLQELPDVQSERVAALKDQIQKGTYKPDLTSVAGAILNDPLSKVGNS